MYPKTDFRCPGGHPCLLTSLSVVLVPASPLCRSPLGSKERGKRMQFVVWYNHIFKGTQCSYRYLSALSSENPSVRIQQAWAPLWWGHWQERGVVSPVSRASLMFLQALSKGPGRCLEASSARLKLSGYSASHHAAEGRLGSYLAKEELLKNIPFVFPTWPFIWKYLLSGNFCKGN